ncbi:MAG: hypothetical protein AB7F41_13235 [Methylocystis sp.]|uniref:hypothetical protein n=1 Tax=Methylocystis sp. TaxID=1911079 RepID=UPI003D0FBFA9
MYWSSDWLWGLPLLVITVVFHVSMFVVLERALAHGISHGQRSRTLSRFIISVAVIALGAATLHGVEAAVWAVLYMGLGALPDESAALLYSLSAFTSYGHSAIYLEDRWKLLGAIEAMNGLILFGLTTAFLFAAIGTVRPDRKAQVPADMQSAHGGG